MSEKTSDLNRMFYPETYHPGCAFPSHNVLLNLERPVGGRPRHNCFSRARIVSARKPNLLLTRLQNRVVQPSPTGEPPAHIRPIPTTHRHAKRIDSDPL